MKVAPTGGLLALLPAVCIGLLAAQPFLSGQISQRGDTLLHLQRVAQLDALIRQGVLYSRWSPDLALGFGYPLFNYYAPLSYYLAELPVLLGFAHTAALALTFTLLFIVSTVGMYVWCRAMFGAHAGVLAAAAYVLSPYVLANATGRGALAEQCALALLPGLMWAAHRMANRRSNGAGLLIAFLCALVLGHNVSTLIFLPIVAVFVLIWQVIAQGFRPAGRWLKIISIFAISFGLTAFFWLPAFAERNLVYIERTTQPVWAHVQNNFVALKDIVAWPMVTDPRLIMISFSPGLSPIILLTLALLFATTVVQMRQRNLREDRQWWLNVLALGGGLFVCVWLSTPLSSGVWNALPLVGYIQFPSRLFGPASLFAAALTGAAWSQVLRRCVSMPMQTSMMILMVLVLAGLAFHRQVLAAPLPATTAFTPQQMAAFEAKTSLFGSTSGQEYTPRTVLTTPTFAQSRWQFQNDLVDRDNIPAGSTIDIAERRPLSLQAAIQTVVPMTLTLRMFAFPGWQATLDGNPISIVPSQPNGFISLGLPTGKHNLQVWFGTTPLRTQAEAISVLCLMLIAFAIVRGRVGLRARATSLPLTGHLNRTQVVSVCATALILVAIKSVYLDHANTPFSASRFDGNAIHDVPWPLHAVFGDDFEWLGADGPATAKPGDLLRLKLFWRVRQPINGELSTSIQLVNQAGVTVAQSDNFVAAGLATFYWQPEQYAVDEHILNLPANLPTGRYHARIVVYPRDQPMRQLSAHANDNATERGIVIEIQSD